MTDIYAYPGQTNPNDVKAHDPTHCFFGILKRWTGATWIKAKLMVRVGGTWVSKTVKRWTGSEWKEIDAGGIT